MRFFYFLSACALIFGHAKGQNIQFEPLYTASSFDSRVIDVSKPVGSTFGQAAVSPTGAAIYSIPVFIPPGTNRVMPKLSFEYNSQGGAGIAGMGWNVSGVSVISRVPQNVYFDGNVSPLSLHTGDRFALDGQRLVIKSGAYGTQGSEYGTEIETFSDIKLQGGAGDNQSWFEIISKDGVKMFYGTTSDSKFLNEEGSVVIFWMLSRVLYPDGNYIDYQYTSTGREAPRLLRIGYTGNLVTGALPYNEIFFEYKVRQSGGFSDVSKAYLAGASIVNRHLLDKVEVRAEGVTVKTYRLAYGNDGINSYLNSIQETDGQGNSLNPTIFKYGDTPVAKISESTTIPFTNNIISFAADFNKDGLNDIMTANYSTENEYVSEFKIWSKVEAAETSYKLAYTQALAPSTTIYNWAKVGRHNTILSSDFDGDGRPDVLTMKIGPTEMHTGGALQDLKLYRSDGVSPFYFSQMTLPIPVNFTGIQSAKTWIQLGDFNGDGRTEYLLFMAGVATSDRAFMGRNSYGSWICEQLSPVGSLAIPISAWRGADLSEAIDFDGDGRQELLLLKDNICEVYSIEGTSVKSLFSSHLFNKAFQYHFGDFNGDGKTDLLQFDPLKADFKVYVSTGIDLTPVVFPVHFPWPSDVWPGGSNKVVVGDFNGDGRSDVYFDWTRTKYANSVPGAYTYYYWGHDVYYSTGESFVYKQIRFEVEVTSPGDPTLAPDGTNDTPTYIYDKPVDLNGDGRTDIFSSMGGRIYCHFFNRDGNDNRIEKVKNGLNHESVWIYDKTAGNTELYGNGESEVNFPLSSLNPSGVLVAKFSAEDGIGGHRSLNYRYKGATFHRQGKGFIGFEHTRTTDEATGMVTNSDYAFSTSHYVAFPKSTFIHFGTGPRTLTNYQNEVVSVFPKIFWVRNSQISTLDYFTGLTTTTQLQFDSFGNVTGKTVTIPGVHSTVTSTTYGAHGGLRPNKPTLISVTDVRNGESPFQVKTKLNYNALGQLTSKVDFFEQPKAVTTTYEYNSLGNVTHTSTSAFGITSRNTSAVFDSKGRYPVQTLNELGQQSSATYDPKWGTELSVTGTDALTTTYQYDGWGRLTKTSFPEGYATDISLHWNVSGQQRYYQQSSTPGTPLTKVGYDVLGREVKTESQAFDGAPVTGFITYDQRGNISTVTEPHKSTETPVAVTRYYDQYNRVVSVNNSITGTISYAYSYASGVLNTTTTTPSGLSTQSLDAAGKLIRSEDGGGALSYSYYSHGGVKETVAQGGKMLTSVTYDPYGRQVMLSDISAGVTEYENDALGQLIWQKTASGHETSMQYNLLGQMTLRTGVEGVTSFVYGAANGGGDRFNKIKSIVGFDGESKNYQYDNFGRLRSVTENLDGNYTTSFTYNTNGALLTTTYPSGLVISNQYNSRGYLEEIKNGNALLYKTASMNGRGQVTAYQKGNGKSSSISYTNGIPTHYLTRGVQDYHLVWDFQRANLLSRRDARSPVNKTETFTYDNLDRLVASSINGAAFTVTYMPDGNIHSKTDAGLYNYDPGKIHAVTGVSNPAPSPIPVLEQNIVYTPFAQPATVAENNYLLTYRYGADYQRVKSELKQNGTTVNTRYYFESGFEMDIQGGVARFVQYISSPVGLVAIVESVGGVHSAHYTYTDHLGSVLTVTNQAGIVEAEQSFDAWGRRRDPYSWTLMPPSASVDLPVWLYRGYTAHEHLNHFGLINMNGRMYDPVLGRMLSPDNYVVNPLYSQDYNRYTYARNNPLVYTDPDGNFWHIVIGAGIGGVFNLGLQAVLGNVNSFGDGLSAFGKGALAGGMSAIGCSSCGAGTLIFGATTAVGATYIPSYHISIGSGFSLSVGGNVGFGSTGLFAGVNFGFNYNSEYFSVGVSHGIGVNVRDNVTGTSGWSSSTGAGLIVGGNNARFGIFTNSFAGRGLDQRTGTLYVESNGWSAAYENDWMLGLPIADGGDRFRTAGVRIAKEDFSLGLNLFTGDPGLRRREVTGSDIGAAYKGTYKEITEQYRLGALYFGNRGYQIGWNSESIRNMFQNKLAHGKGFRFPLFEVLKTKGVPYLNYQRLNSLFTTWY